MVYTTVIVSLKRGPKKIQKGISLPRVLTVLIDVSGRIICMTAIKKFCSQFIIFCFRGVDSKHFHERRLTYLTVWIFNLGDDNFPFKNIKWRHLQTCKKKKKERKTLTASASLWKMLRTITFTLQSQVCRPVPHAQHTQTSIWGDWTEECTGLLNMLLPLTTEFTACSNS